ncbi:uncharacterized protein MKZ38_001855 [Zalerion maritima]|uniref:DUF8004 domain-containing protein n=1 Tax=Zalerion maritima TaxID=339359 RepID=A0AAD5RPT3_9PEZI|nr:uncharacterized protein MKZ38_001855 [Zalerion maritima]
MMAATPEDRQRPNSLQTRSPSIYSESREFGLYNGKSNRARGWKSKSAGEFVDNRPPSHTNDPELWLRDGNCYVHLYGVGQSRRGPAFRVPFSALLSAKCRPLLNKYLVPVSPVQPQARSRSMSQPYLVNHGDEGSATRFDLYIPSPPTSDKDQAFHFHIATRNFFAWLVRKPLVGKDLGSAMIILLKTMQEFRSHAQNNVGDLLAYLDVTGYLDMRSQPHFALAMLHLAEFFQLRELYIDAFAHCTGMCDRLFLSPEYQHVSSVSRKLIRRAKNEMDSRLNAAGTMLRSFLEEELSETHLGLPAGSRIHLERFRSFLREFYADKCGLGYFPAVPIEKQKDLKTSVFPPTIFYIMRRDFECLYGFLVDAGFSTAEDSPFLATGGICTLQCVQSFDMRHRFVSLPQPLPLLPDYVEPTTSRRKSWLGRNDKASRPDYRLLAHAALLRASNMEDSSLLENDLVRAYRKSEEDYIFNLTKAEKLDKVSLVDARKVRWILVYCIYQALRSVTEPPPQVRRTEGVPYHLATGTDLLPPWREDRVTYPPASCHRLPPGSTRNRGRAHSMSAASGSAWSHCPSQHLSTNTEIKPDIDYFALANKSATTQNTPLNSTPGTPRRSRSLTRSKAASSTIRHSLSIFSKHPRNGSPPPSNRKSAVPVEPHHRRTPTYHEIVVHGYGNGTQNVTMATEYVTTPLHEPTSSPGATAANRSLSNASKSSDGSADSAATVATAATSATASTASSSAPSELRKPPLNSPKANKPPSRISTLTSKFQHFQPRGRPEHLLPGSITIPARTSSASSSRSATHHQSSSPGPIDSTTWSSSESPDSDSPRSSQSRFRNTIGGLEDLRSGSKILKNLHPSPLRVQRDYSNLRIGAGPDEWEEVQHEMKLRIEKEDGDVKPMWEQFADLGGLTKVA